MEERRGRGWGRFPGERRPRGALTALLLSSLSLLSLLSSLLSLSLPPPCAAQDLLQSPQDLQDSLQNHQDALQSPQHLRELLQSPQHPQDSLQDPQDSLQYHQESLQSPQDLQEPQQSLQHLQDSLKSPQHPQDSLQDHQDSLQSPQDLQVLVVNTNFTLSWSHPDHQHGVTFWAQYRETDTAGAEWQDLPGCCNVSGTACDFSSAISEYYDVHSLRVRAQRAGHTSPWSRELDMVPEHEAQIGPPGIELQPTNGGIKIKISPPEANQPKKMWIDHTTFNYNLIFWENSSDSQPRSRSVFPIDTIEGLSPDTTYCFRVWATLPVEGKEGQPSPPRCASTTHREPLCATNLRVLGLNMEFSLLWDGDATQNGNYTAQFLNGYFKKCHEDYSENWKSIPGCQHIRGTNCNISSIITATQGFYYLRVLAQGGHNSSCLSREVEVDPLITNEIGPPGVKLDISDTLLHIQISPPGGELMKNSYGLSYRILYWKNSSNAEEEPQVKETKQTVATIADLAPSTWYCVRVQALSEAYNKSSAYSQEQCTLSPAEQTFPLVTLVTFTVALVAVLLVVLPLVFVLYQACSKLRYVFFPSCQTPLNIEGFGGQLFSSPYLAAPEEPIENCSIIESMITYEGNQIHLNDWKHSKESSRDSGNYSNDDTSGSKGSAETLEKEMI